MGKYWISSTFHTLKPEDLWAREMCERGPMDYFYWIRAIQVATPLFYDDGKCLLMDYMEWKNYVEGRFRCIDFEDDMSSLLGKRGKDLPITKQHEPEATKSDFEELGMVQQKPEVENLMEKHEPEETDYASKEFVTKLEAKNLLVVEKHEPEETDYASKEFVTKLERSSIMSLHRHQRKGQFGSFLYPKLYLLFPTNHSKEDVLMMCEVHSISLSLERC
ncbi:hypothetical protein POM88_047966 [Heracleum sosnowskyi]|uniref:Uncharacterized protein n=1 Tax=Heracleum sosnowskyi TaxID=360622 RepID=A0AAD8GT06_9APIA|nr:hypothetical protein POM88_047966 [Heracleum sosnowskyi]